jgi:translation initiation factor 1 (eIF-1/SUI1)
VARAARGAGSLEDKKTLLKKLKAQCGGGGKVTAEGQLEVQGDHVAALLDTLVSLGYTGAKKSGGK